jgi:L-ascorbate metabolism protein UlaG (beta-lactamase superfamily)
VLSFKTKIIMEIKYLGHSCFRLKGKKIILLTDPYGEAVGYKMPPASAHIVTVSHDHFDHNNIAAVHGTSTREEPFIINGPGEYEISGITIFGFPSYHDEVKGADRGKNTIYLINMDGIKIAHLGDLGHSLSDSLLEELNTPDVVFVPVGGTFTLGPREALKVVNQLEPKIVIPMHYQVPASSPEMAGKLAPVEDFLKEVGIKEFTSVEELTVTPESLPQEETRFVVLKVTS